MREERSGRKAQHMQGPWGRREPAVEWEFAQYEIVRDTTGGHKKTWNLVLR